MIPQREDAIWRSVSANVTFMTNEMLLEQAVSAVATETCSFQGDFKCLPRLSVCTDLFPKRVRELVQKQPEGLAAMMNRNCWRWIIFESSQALVNVGHVESGPPKPGHLSGMDVKGSKAVEVDNSSSEGQSWNPNRLLIKSHDYVTLRNSA